MREGACIGAHPGRAMCVSCVFITAVFVREGGGHVLREMCVFITAGPIIKLCAGGGGGQ